jgi:transcriptional regulator with XRE-family HTH domain
MPTDLLDTNKLAAMVRAKRGELGLRDTAARISEITGKISPATLSRVEQGKAPDVDTFLRICTWLHADPAVFSTNSSKNGASGKRGTLEVVEAHLRADKALSPKATEAIVDMIRLVLKQENKK